MSGDEREAGRESGLGRRSVLALTGAMTAGLLLEGGTARAAEPDQSRVLGVRQGVTLHRITFTTPDGVTLVGHLRTPQGDDGARPAVVFANAMTSVKDQSVQAGYAHGLAAAGFVTLVFDQRGFGESGGSPRLHEDIESRLGDLHVAVSHLGSLRRWVDPDRIGAFGVSIGGGLAMRLTATDPRVRAFVAVAAGLHDPQRFRELFGPPRYAAALAEQTDALRRFHQTGELEYIPVVRTGDFTGPVLFDNPIAAEYYGTRRGASDVWQNRVSALSLRTLLVHDVRHAADMVGPRAGMLAVGTEDVATLPKDHRAVHNRLTGPRELLLVRGATHNDLYDRPEFTGQVTDQAAEWFGTHL
jgi:fermentation-respiration switch protein FrsA (DUF1100 family)